MKKIIFALAMLISSNLFASSDHYSFVYIPISDPQEAREIKLHKAIIFTWYAEPDFSLSAVTHPYIVNTPHGSYQNQYQNMNINLANIKGLSIDLTKLYAKDCEVIIDAQQIKIRNANSKKTDKDSVPKDYLMKVLKAVKDATRLNLESHKMDCRITTKL